MRAGRLKHRVTIQSLSRSADERGTVVGVWQDVGEVWAAVEPIRARERLTASQLQADTTHKVTLRYDAFRGLTSRHRFRFGDRILNLAGPPINPDEDNESWEALCVEEEQGDA